MLEEGSDPPISVSEVFEESEEERRHEGAVKRRSGGTDKRGEAKEWRQEGVEEWRSGGMKERRSRGDGGSGLYYEAGASCPGEDQSEPEPHSG